jgi:hypothetical protein
MTLSMTAATTPTPMPAWAPGLSSVLDLLMFEGIGVDVGVDVGDEECDVVV